LVSLLRKKNVANQLPLGLSLGHVAILLPLGQCISNNNVVLCGKTSPLGLKSLWVSLASLGLLPMCP